MQTNLPRQIGYFALSALTGFMLLWLLENRLTDFLSLAVDGGDSRLLQYLSLKISTYGKAETLMLVSQLKFRWLALSALAAWLLFAQGKPQDPGDENAFRWRIRLFFGISILYLPDLLKEMSVRWQWSGLYEPALLPGYFFREMPSIVLLQFAGLAAFGLSAWLVLSKWKNGSGAPAWISLALLLCWLLLLSVYQAGGSIDHAWASLQYGMMFMSLWLFTWWKFPDLKATGFRLFQAGIWGCYFFAGLEKIFLSGIHWFSPEHFGNLCLLHPGKGCDWFAAHPVLAGAALFAVLAFQLLSPLQWRFPRWGYVTAGTGLLFHLGTWLILGVGGWQSPWMAMLVFLLPLTGNHSREEVKRAF